MAIDMVDKWVAQLHCSDRRCRCGSARGCQFSCALGHIPCRLSSSVEPAFSGVEDFSRAEVCMMRAIPLLVADPKTTPKIEDKMQNWLRMTLFAKPLKFLPSFIRSRGPLCVLYRSTRNIVYERLSSLCKAFFETCYRWIRHLGCQSAYKYVAANHTPSLPSLSLQPANSSARVCISSRTAVITIIFAQLLSTVRRLQKRRLLLP